MERSKGMIGVQEHYLCDVSMMVLPAFLTSTSVFQSCRLATGSMPVVGSSRKTIGGSPTNAMAVLSLRLLPPLLKYYSAWNTHKCIILRETITNKGDTW